jgi:hypothetical protein
MATSQLRTLSTLNTQVERPINSPALYESEAKKEASKSKKAVDYITPIVSFYDALPDGEDKQAAREIVLTINPDKELILEDVVSDLSTALESTDPDTAQIAYDSILHLMNLYEQATTKADAEEPVITRMRHAIKTYESNLPVLAEIGQEAN